MAKPKCFILSLLLVLGAVTSAQAIEKHKRPVKSPIQRSTGCVTLSSQSIQRVQITSQPSYPPINPGQTSFEIPAPDICAHISLLLLPANFVLRVAPGISTIQWQVDQIQFGPGAVFDLSASQVKLPKPAKPPAERQADYCAFGNQGATATGGKNGGNAINLIITGLQTIVNSSGGLWIRNDGGPGQDAGDSGDGQQGGGHWGTWPNECERHAGGRPGYLSPSGRGGATSVVSITGYPSLTPPVEITVAGKKPVKVIKIAAPSGACGPSARPPGATSNTGAIVVFGQVGCNGQAGQPGKYGD